MPVKKTYLELQIEFQKNNKDDILNTLYLAGIKNILEEENTFKIYLPGPGNKLAERIEDFLKARCNLDSKNIRHRKFENRDWDKEWKKSLKPVIINDKIIISPGPGESPAKLHPGNIFIEIVPKMSFGTGHNETTQLILEFLTEVTGRSDKYLLDYGCGTGILAIAAIKLGIKKAVAIDIDSDSVQNANEYFKKNGVSNKVKLYKNNISGIKEKDFDIICANIIRSVIEDNLDCITGKLKKGGKLLISGILNREIDKLKERLIKKNYSIEKIKFKSEWAGIYARKT